LVTYLILILMVIYYLFFTTNLLLVFICLIIMMFILGLKHRGILHRPISGIIIGIAVGWLFSSYIIILFIVIGYWTHLICDIRIIEKDNYVNSDNPFE